MTINKKRKQKKLNITVFIFFLLSYFLVGTTVNIPGIKLFRWIGSVILLFFGLKDHIDNRKLFVIWPNQFWLIFIAVMLSLIVNLDLFMPGLFKFISVILLFSGIYTFLDIKTITCEDIKIMFTLFCWSVIALVLWQFSLLLFSPSEFGVFKGIFSNKNYLVSVSSVGIACSLWILMKNRKIGIVLTLISLIITFATGSRTGVILAIFILFMIPFIFVTKITKKSILKIMILLVFILSGIYYIIQYADIPAVDRLFAEQSSDGSTGFSRNGIWDLAWPILEQNFFLGIGANGVYYAIKQRINYGFHNSYLVLLVETGIIGFSMYLLFFIITFKKIIKKYRRYIKTKEEKIFLKILLIICFSLLINAFSESFLFAVGNSVSMYFWLSLFIIIVYLEKILKENKDEYSISN